MKLHQLKYLLAIVESGSMRNAARQLNISEPALSKSIHQLEQVLDAQLLDRGPRGVVPTVFGESLASHAAIVLNEVQRAKRELAEIRQTGRGVVSIGTGPTAATTQVPKAVSRFSAKHPNVRVAVVEGIAGDLASQVLKRELDFAIVVTEPANLDPELEYENLAESTIAPVCRMQHPLAGRKNLTTKDLAAARWLLPPRGDQIRQRFEAFVKERGLGPVDIVAESKSVLFALSYITMSDALGFPPVQIVTDPHYSKLLTVLQIPELLWRRQLALISARRFSLSPLARALMREIRFAYSL